MRRPGHGAPASSRGGMDARSSSVVGGTRGRWRIVRSGTPGCCGGHGVLLLLYVVVVASWLGKRAAQLLAPGPRERLVLVLLLPFIGAAAACMPPPQRVSDNDLSFLTNGAANRPPSLIGQTSSFLLSSSPGLKVSFTLYHTIIREEKEEKKGMSLLPRPRVPIVPSVP
ncbi:hypothetical protein SEVIR_9G548650v4 [Setaria viridis]